MLELADESGAAVSLVGWSLGGVIAREVARRHPEAVRRVITYGTPVVGGRRLRRPVADPGRRSPRCSPGATASSRGARASTVRSPHVEHVEVGSTHLGMGVDPDVWGLVADRLAVATG